MKKFGIWNFGNAKRTLLLPFGRILEIKISAFKRPASGELMSIVSLIGSIVSFSGYSVAISSFSSFKGTVSSVSFNSDSKISSCNFLCNTGMSFNLILGEISFS